MHSNDWQCEIKMHYQSSGAQRMRHYLHTLGISCNSTVSLFYIHFVNIGYVCHYCAGYF